MATVVVYFGARLTARPKPVPPPSTNTLPGIVGLNEGEVAALPDLITLTNDPVRLSNLDTGNVLCVFFSPSCAGCVQDVELWRDLKQESTKRKVAFYLIDVGSNRDELDKFVEAYALKDLPILIDPNRAIGKNLKINFVPQYLLFSQNGMVRRRLDGVRHYDRALGSNQLNQFFLVD